MNGADPEAALCAAAARLLRSSGREALAELLEHAELRLDATEERWEMGSRSVSAQRVVLVLEPDAFVRLRDDAEALEAARSAIAEVVRSPTTELAELMLVVRLPEVGRPWADVYRQVSPRAPEDDAPERVLAAATALAFAYGAEAVRRALEAAELEAEDLPSEGPRLRRWVVRLLPADLARAERDGPFFDVLRRSVTHAATRAGVRVADVELRVREDRGP